MRTKVLFRSLLITLPAETDPVALAGLVSTRVGLVVVDEVEPRFELFPLEYLDRWVLEVFQSACVQLSVVGEQLRTWVVCVHKDPSSLPSDLLGRPEMPLRELEDGLADLQARLLVRDGVARAVERGLRR